MAERDAGTSKYAILSKFGILMIAAILFIPLIPLQTALGADAETHWKLPSGHDCGTCLYSHAEKPTATAGFPRPFSGVVSESP